MHRLWGVIPTAPETLGISQEDYGSAGKFLTEKRLGNLETEPFDKLVARDATLFSSLAYLDEPQLGHLSLSRIIQDRPNTSAQVGVFKTKKNENVLVVAFRGTEMGDLGRFTVGQVLQDWWINFKCCLCPFDKEHEGFGLIHEGFQQSLEILWKAGLGMAIEAHQGRILITGHSQGGGLATALAAKLLLQVKRSQFILYAIAPPKIGDITLTTAINDAADQTKCPLIRLSNLDDPIPYLPPFPDYAPGPGLHYHIYKNDTIASMSDEDYFRGVPELKFDSLGEGVQDSSKFLAWAVVKTNPLHHFPGCPWIGVWVRGYLRLLRE